ncbi:MAG: hypothetical protein WCI02_11035 [Planctomycetota bacterium]
MPEPKRQECDQDGESSVAMRDKMERADILSERAEIAESLANRTQGMTAAVEWGWFFSAIAGSFGAIALGHWWWDRLDGIPSACVALVVCAMTTAVAIRWRRGGLGATNPVASTLLAITFRTLVMIGALGFLAATKWTYINSFSSSLLGCYFLFLVLESGLSIAWYSSQTRVTES